MEFKGTKGNLERKYVSGICIGIGTIGEYSQITANSIIEHIETDKQYSKEKQEIEANMLLYSKAPEMLEMLKEITNQFQKVDKLYTVDIRIIEKSKNLIKEATTL